jgi:DNA-binding MurR/RpiR family transcriptional regulator
MGKDILTLLQEKSSGFSKGQKRICQYILESYDKAAFLTANKLGKAVGVSESTVVRFAMDLGYDGYPSMQKAMQAMMLTRLTSQQRMEVAHDRIVGEDVITSVLHADMDKLRQTLDIVDRNSFDAAVNDILQAKRVYILGARSTAPLAEFLGYYLNYMLRHVHVVTTDMFEGIIQVEAGDAVIAISFPRYSSATVRSAQFARSTGATVIGLTDSSQSPLEACCDRILLAKSDMLSLVDSLVAPMSVINALIVAIASRREKELAQTFDTLEQIWATNHVYEKQDGML